MKYYTYREFASATFNTIRTLRYYEKVGLLKPIMMHEIRYLCEDDFVKIQTIQLLKNANYTLEEIKDILHDRNIEEQIIIQEDLLNIQLTNIKSMLSLIDELKQKEDIQPVGIYQRFLQIQNDSNLQMQFGSAEGLKTRVHFHHFHTRYEENFHQWMFQHYSFPPLAKVLDIGCGDGTLWDCNRDKIPPQIEIILSDISDNMIKESIEKCQGISQIKAFEKADCFSLPYQDEQFDIVIANHLFMYFDDLKDAIKEIYRVLKPHGILYCSTIAKDMMKERDILLKNFDKKISFHQDVLYQRFGYENGKNKLDPFFSDIQLFERKEHYKIQDAELFTRFLLSGKGLSTDMEPLYRKQKQFREFLETYIKDHSFIPLCIHAGMFSARKRDHR